VLVDVELEELPVLAVARAERVARLGVRSAELLGCEQGGRVALLNLTASTSRNRAAPGSSACEFGSPPWLQPIGDDVGNSTFPIVVRSAVSAHPGPVF
jgi:hypothetical protein